MIHAPFRSTLAVLGMLVLLCAPSAAAGASAPTAPSSSAAKLPPSAKISWQRTPPRLSKLAVCKKRARKRPTAKARRTATRKCEAQARREERARQLAARRKRTTGPGPGTPTNGPGAMQAPDEPPVEGASRAPEVVQTSPMQDELVACANEERASVELPLLRVDPALVRAAQGHAEDMNAREYFGHESPEGMSFGDRIRAQLAGTDPFSSMGENIARDHAMPRDACNAWMNSKDHRENVLSPNYTAVGAGFESGYSVLDFGGR